MTTILSAAGINDLQDNLKRRGESFKAGMLLLVDALKNLKVKKIDGNKEKSQLIEKYIGTVVCIDEFYEQYESTSADVTILEAGEDNLGDLLSKYKQLLQANPSLDDPFRSLCDAERYSVWKNGRETFDTVVKSSQYEITGVDVKNSQLEMTQQEIPCHDPDLLAEEYKKINDKTPPFWFQWLSPWQQEFIGKNRNTLIKNSIPSSLRSVPGLANLSKHVCRINGVERLAYFRHATQRPVDLMNNKDAYDEEYRITCLNMASQIRLSLEDQFKQAESKQIEEAVILTQSLLSPGTAADLKSKISGPSDNDTQIYKMKEEIVELFQYALSHPHKSVDEKHVPLKVLFFSLNQAVYYKDFLAKWGLEAQDGLFKYKDREPLKITLLSTNHPLNILRCGGVYTPQTTNNDYNTALLLGAVGRFLMPIVVEHSEKIHLTQQFPFFNQLLKTLSKCEEEKLISINDKQNLIKILDSLLGIDYKLKLQPNILLLFHAIHMLLSTPLGQGSLTDKDLFDVRHKQLLISSAEAIILNCIQGSLWVACKSGKDRTGIASIAYDAALLYFVQYGKLPGHKDEQHDRDAYISLLKSLFDSGHQQKAAGQNAPGAKGIVEPGMILPADVKIDKCTNTKSTFFARLNKPADPEGRKMMAPLSSLKNLTKKLFFKHKKEPIPEIEIPMANIFRSS